jgi:NOL1/NOP2/sun family putative RNA methylase
VKQESIPAELLQSLKGVKDFDEKNFVEAHEHPKQVVSIRLNTLKCKGDISDFFEGAQQVPWSSNGYYLPSRPAFIFDPMLHGGAYYVQEASGMFIEQCLRQTLDLNRRLIALDLCAAPGGKSTLIQSLISPESILVSNEVIKSRASILVENMSKWGAENVIVTNNDPRDFSRLPNFFDVMVIDAPCSGSGLFRKDPEAIDEWSESAVQTCSLRQQRIIDDAWVALKNDGILIYSTCSYSPEENEQICDWLMSNYSAANIRLKVAEEWNIVETESTKSNSYGYRFFPDKLKGEGFFVACFRKINDDPANVRIEKSRRIKSTAAEKKVVEPWLQPNKALDILHSHDELFAFPSDSIDVLSAIESNLYIKKAGVSIGKVLKYELIPAHELALSLIKNEQLLSISLKKEDALQYLRREEVTIEGSKKGWSLVEYNGIHIGWIKMLGNRINNYYPKEWRILKSGTS